MKTLFTSREIAHIWAHAHENPNGPQHGRCPGNLSFDVQLPSKKLPRGEPVPYPVPFSSALKSYSTVIARILPGAGKHKKDFCALLNSRGYSVSTNKAQSMARRAVSHLPCFSLGGDSRGDSFHFTGQGVFAEFKASALALVESAHKARILARTREDFLARARSEIENANRAKEFFALRCKALDPEKLAVLSPALLEKHKKQSAEQALRDKRGRAEHEKKLAALRELAAEALPVYLAAWRAHAEVASNVHENFTQKMRALGQWRCDPILAVAPGNCALRLSADGSRVETSQGAQVLLRTVKFLGKLCAEVKASGQALPADKCTALPVLDNYRVDAVDAEGNVRVGCHLIAFSEIQSINTQTEEVK